jgi:hypothetical protein
MRQGGDQVPQLVCIELALGGEGVPRATEVVVSAEVLEVADEDVGASA